MIQYDSVPLEKRVPGMAILLYKQNFASESASELGDIILDRFREILRISRTNSIFVRFAFRGMFGDVVCNIESRDYFFCCDPIHIQEAFGTNPTKTIQSFKITV